MTQQAEAPASGADDRIDAAVLKIAGVVVLGAIMSILDMTVVNVALPTFQTSFANHGAPLAYSLVAWTVTAYTLALATVIPLTGWAADRFGTKRLYIAAIAMFTIGSVLCATAWSIEALITFRVVQGLGGGMLMPLGMTIMTRAAGPHRMGRLMAILGVPMLLGPILGPILGGWLIDAASWHWIFLINLPIGIAGLIYAASVLPADRPRPSESFDFLGMLLLSPGLALFLYGVSTIPEKGTVASPWVWVPGVAGIALIAAFTLHALRKTHPLLDLRLFRDANLRWSIITMFMFSSAFFGALLLVPTYFQQVRGESVLMSGLLVAPQGIGAMITMPIAGQLADRIPVGRIAPVGMVLIALGIGLLALAGSTTGYLYLTIVLFVIGLGMGITMMPLFTAALRSLRSREVARGSTLLNITQQIASSVGVALISVVLTNQLKSGDLALPAIAAVKDPSLVPRIGGPAGLADGLKEAAAAFSASYWFALALVVLAFVPTYFLPRREMPPVPHDDGDEEGGEALEGPAPVIAH